MRYRMNRVDVDGAPTGKDEGDVVGLLTLAAVFRSPRTINIAVFCRKRACFIDGHIVANPKRIRKLSKLPTLLDKISATSRLREVVRCFFVHVVPKTA